MTAPNDPSNEAPAALAPAPPEDGARPSAVDPSPEADRDGQAAEVARLEAEAARLQATVDRLEAEIDEWEALKESERARLRDEVETEARAVLAERRQEVKELVALRVQLAVGERKAALADRARVLDHLERSLEEKKEGLEAREAEIRLREKRVEKERKHLERDQANLATQKAVIQGRERETLQARGDAEARLADAAGRLKAVEEREWALRAKEAEVVAGLPERAEAVRAQLDEAFARLDEERLALEAERAAWAVTQDEAVVAERSRLQTEASRLKARETALEAQRTAYEEDVEDLREEQAALAQSVEQRAGAHAKKLEARVAHLQASLTAMTETAEGYHQELQALRVSEVRTKGRSVRDLDQEVERLRGENERLQSALDERPSVADRERLHDLERERERWTRERDDLMGRVRDLQADASLSTVERARFADLESEAASWRNEVELLRGRLDRLNELISAGKAHQSAFPRLLALDHTAGLQEPPAVEALRRADRLPVLVEAVRGELGRRRLHYSSDTLRLYLAGLAMSRLVLLEGMPGTGKTTLARAFAEVLGAGSAKVEVQAGWRDKQDLLGHYNTFERQFSETPFLEALYQAQTPAHADRPFFIVLDEMNLSRPEYYFADFLSLLEDRETEPAVQIPRGATDAVAVSIMNKPLAFHSNGTAPAGEAGELTTLPVGLRRTKGMELGVPDNVWFVATANQDESTLQPAPKTYARAHVQVLPPTPAAADRTEGTPFDFDSRPLGFAGLYQAFEDAVRTCSAEVGWAEGVLDQLAGPLREHDVAWPNRLMRQMRPFVAVYAASGGAREDALDHLIATKVLHSLRNRFGLTRRALGEIREALDLVSEEAAGGAPFRSSLAVLSSLEGQV